MCAWCCGCLIADTAAGRWDTVAKSLWHCNSQRHAARPCATWCRRNCVQKVSRLLWRSGKRPSLLHWEYYTADITDTDYLFLLMLKCYSRLCVPTEVNPNPNPPGLRNATELNRNTPHAFNYTNCDLFNVNCTSFNKAYSPDRFLWYKSYKTVSLKHGTCTLNISAGRVHGPCPRPVRGHGRPKWRPWTRVSKWYPWTRASRMCTELENQVVSLEWCPGAAVSWNINKTSAYEKLLYWLSCTVTFILP